MKGAITRTGLATAATNVALCACFLAFAWAHAGTFARTQRPSALLMVAIEAIVDSAIRLRSSSGTSSPFASWIAA